MGEAEPSPNSYIGSATDRNRDRGPAGIEPGFSSALASSKTLGGSPAYLRRCERRKGKLLALRERGEFPAQRGDAIGFME
jgi:hypothetical protein